MASRCAGIALLCPRCLAESTCAFLPLRQSQSLPGLLEFYLRPDTYLVFHDHVNLSHDDDDAPQRSYAHFEFQQKIAA